MNTTEARTFYTIHFTGEGFRTLAFYRLFYRDALRTELKRRQAYEDEVAEWFTTGDGQAPNWQRAGDQPWFDGEWDNAERMVNLGGKGYRFPYCPHGTDLTTDYDNICWACEDSRGAADVAIGIAREHWLRFVNHFEWIQAAPPDVDDDFLRSETQRLFDQFKGMDYAPIGGE